ncbi:nuclear transport factor 2 family protein [Sessilibacter corallicola]
MRKMLMVRLIASFLACLLWSGLTEADEGKAKLKAIGEDYFSVYANRRDIDRLMTFYDPKVVLKDMVYGNHIQGRENLKKFFDWGNDNFKLVDGNESLKVTRQYYDQNTIFTEGYFHPFHYYGEQLGPVHTNLITPAGVYFFRILGAVSVIWLFQMNELQHEIREKYAEPLGSPLKHAIRCCSSLI